MVWKHTFHSKGSIDNTRKCWPNGSNATQIWCWLCVIRLQLRAPATQSPSSWMKIKSNLCCYKRALVVRTSFKHICKPHVNIDLVISPKVIDATLNKSSMKIFIFFPCTNASQLVRSGLVHLHFVANHSLWKMHLTSVFIAVQLVCVFPLWDLVVTCRVCGTRFLEQEVNVCNPRGAPGTEQLVFERRHCGFNCTCVECVFYFELLNSFLVFVFVF